MRHKKESHGSRESHLASHRKYARKLDGTPTHTHTHTHTPDSVFHANDCDPRKHGLFVCEYFCLTTVHTFEFESVHESSKVCRKGRRAHPQTHAHPQAHTHTEASSTRKFISRTQGNECDTKRSPMAAENPTLLHIESITKVRRDTHTHTHTHTRHRLPRERLRPEKAWSFRV